MRPYRICTAIATALAMCLALPATALATGEEALVVRDASGRWQQANQCDAFHNIRLGAAALHPGVEDMYLFTMENTGNTPLGYTLVVKETNPHDIPMEYRLRADGAYAAGDEEGWIRDEQIVVLEGELPPGAIQQLELDWRWLLTSGEEGDAHDTNLGSGARQQELPYTLAITVDAEDGDDTQALQAGGSAGSLPSGSWASWAGKAVQTGDGAQTVAVAIAAVVSAVLLYALLCHRRTTRGKGRDRP